MIRVTHWNQSNPHQSAQRVKSSVFSVNPPVVVTFGVIGTSLVYFQELKPKRAGSVPLAPETDL